MDPAKCKLGLKPPRPEQQKRLLKLRNYTATLPDPPQSTDYRAKMASWPMLLNDQAGCCVFTSIAHQQLYWATLDSGNVSLSDNDVLTAYESLAGYDPQATQADGSNPTDGGAVIIDMLNVWRQSGIYGNKLIGYAAVGDLPAPTVNRVEFQQAVATFGCVNIGINLPAAWQGAAVWRAPRGREQRQYPWSPNSWGGHATTIIDYDQRYCYVATWGAVIPLEWAAADIYVSEAYVNFDALWFGDDDTSPSGIDSKMLAYDLSVISGSPIAKPEPLSPAAGFEIVIPGTGSAVHAPARAGDLVSFGVKNNPKTLP